MKYPDASLNLNDLKEINKRMRSCIIKMLTKAKSGHPGGSLSAVELVSALFMKVMNHSPENMCAPDHDIFVLSKGHAVPVLYSAFAETGYIDPECLTSLRQINSPIQGHPDKVMLECLTASTGSLGQGLSIAQGYAMAAKMDETKRRVYCLLGDGECNEGQVWEAIMSAGHYKLANMTAIIDYNKAQIDGLTKDVMDLEPLKGKLEAFNWEVFEIDGHDIDAILEALEACKKVSDKPQMIIAHTIKGKGVSYMESNLVGWHGSVPNEEQAQIALAEIEKA